MSKSSIADILEVQRLVSKLDRRGKLAILNDLLKQDLEAKKQEANTTHITSTGARVPATYTEGGEQ